MLCMRKEKNVLTKIFNVKGRENTLSTYLLHILSKCSNACLDSLYINIISLIKYKYNVHVYVNPLPKLAWNIYSVTIWRICAKLSTTMSGLRPGIIGILQTHWYPGSAKFVTRTSHVQHDFSDRMIAERNLAFHMHWFAWSQNLKTQDTFKPPTKLLGNDLANKYICLCRSPGNHE